MGATKKQVTCKVNGEEYTITPTFLTIDEIEAYLSLSELATRLQVGDVRVSSLARCLHSALVAEGYEIAYPDVGHAVINEIGVEKAAEKVSEIVDIALGGGPSKKKGTKKKAAAKKKSAK